jgi:hypothetical protein
MDIAGDFPQNYPDPQACVLGRTFSPLLSLSADKEKGECRA